MDDLLIVWDIFYLCLHNLPVLKRCKETNLLLNWEKWNFMVLEGVALSHKISAHGSEVDWAKIEVLEKFSPPISVKAIRSFCRRFIKIHPKSLNLYTIFWKRRYRSSFDEECLQAFAYVKEKLISHYRCSRLGTTLLTHV